MRPERKRCLFLRHYTLSVTGATREVVTGPSRDLTWDFETGLVQIAFSLILFDPVLLEQVSGLYVSLSDSWMDLSRLTISSDVISAEKKCAFWHFMMSLIDEIAGNMINGVLTTATYKIGGTSCCCQVFLDLTSPQIPFTLGLFILFCLINLQGVWVA